MTFINTFGTPPDFVNAEGTKWWMDASTTFYAQRPDKNGTVLDAVCFYVETVDGYRSRVLVSKAQEIIEEEQSLEAMAIKIDMRKFLKHDHELNPENPKPKKARKAKKQPSDN